MSWIKSKNPFSGSKFVNPLLIDPNERVTPSHSGAGMTLSGGDDQHNLMQPGAGMDESSSSTGDDAQDASFRNLIQAGILSSGFDRF